MPIYNGGNKDDELTNAIYRTMLKGAGMATSMLSSIISVIASTSSNKLDEQKFENVTNVTELVAISNEDTDNSHVQAASVAFFVITVIINILLILHTWGQLNHGLKEENYGPKTRTCSPNLIPFIGILTGIIIGSLGFTMSNNDPQAKAAMKASGPLVMSLFVELSLSTREKQLEALGHDGFDYSPC